MAEHGCKPIAPFKVELKEPEQPEPDAGESGFDPGADAFAYLDDYQATP